jgi:hypothetical protein
LVSKMGLGQARVLKFEFPWKSPKTNSVTLESRRVVSLGLTPFTILPSESQRGCFQGTYLQIKPFTLRISMKRSRKTVTSFYTIYNPMYCLIFCFNFVFRTVFYGFVVIFELFEVAISYGSFKVADCLIWLI